MGDGGGVEHVLYLLPPCLILCLLYVRKGLIIDVAGLTIDLITSLILFWAWQMTSLFLFSSTCESAICFSITSILVSTTLIELSCSINAFLNVSLEDSSGSDNANPANDDSSELTPYGIPLSVFVPRSFQQIQMVASHLKPLVVYWPYFWRPFDEVYHEFL
jgi:ABC-type transport system involved in multi-copper enzyme maturation permease subunit